MKKVMGFLIVSFFGLMLLSSCSLNSSQTSVLGGGSLSGSTIEVGSGAYTVSFKVVKDVRLKAVYSTLNDKTVKLKTTQQITFTGVSEGVYYVNLMNTDDRWAVENKPPVQALHRELIFPVMIKINDQDWRPLSSQDTELVGGQWWNLKIIVM